MSGWSPGWQEALLRCPGWRTGNWRPTLTDLATPPAATKYAVIGLLIVDTETGDTVEWVRIEGVVRELFDVAMLPGVRCPSLIGLKGNDVLRVLSIDGATS